MATPIKPTVEFDSTFGALDIRVAKVLEVLPAEGTPKPAYYMKLDFGKYGQKFSVGRFTSLAPEQLVGSLVLAVLNFEARQVGRHTSEVLVLGVQKIGAASGEAVPLRPAEEVKLGSKVF